MVEFAVDLESELRRRVGVIAGVPLLRATSPDCRVAELEGKLAHPGSDDSGDGLTLGVGARFGSAGSRDDDDVSVRFDDEISYVGIDVVAGLHADLASVKGYIERFCHNNLPPYGYKDSQDSHTIMVLELIV